MIKKINLTNEIDSFNNNGFIIFDKFLLEENIEILKKLVLLKKFKLLTPQHSLWLVIGKLYLISLAGIMIKIIDP